MSSCDLPCQNNFRTILKFAHLLPLLNDIYQPKVGRHHLCLVNVCVQKSGVRMLDVICIVGNLSAIPNDIEILPESRVALGYLVSCPIIMIQLLHLGSVTPVSCMLWALGRLVLVCRQQSAWG